MTQVIRTEHPDNSGTNAVLIVLLLAALVAFGVWFFGQQGVAPAATDEAINVDVNLPAGTTGGAADSGANPGGQE